MAKIKTLSSKISLLSLILVLAAFCISIFYDGGQINREILFSTVLLILLANIFLITYAKLQSLRMTILDLFVITFGAVLIINPFWSVHYDVSRFFSWELSLLPLAYFYFRFYESSYKPIYICGIVLALFFSAWAFIDLLAMNRRVSGAFYDANAFASLLIIFLLPISLSWLNQSNIKQLSGKKTDRLLDLLSVSLFLTAFALFATQSRSGIVAFIISLILLLLYAVKVLHVRKKTVLYLLVLLFIAWLTVKAVSSLEARDWVVSAENQGFTARFKMWKASLEHYYLAPLTGTGLGTFSILYKITRPLDEMSAGQSAHNDVIQLLHEGGPILIVSYMALILLLLLGAYKIWKNADMPTAKTHLIFALSLSGLALFIQSSLTYVIYMLPFALLIGAVAGMQAHLFLSEAKSIRQVDSVKPRLRFFKVGITVFFLLLLSGFCLRMYLINVFGESKDITGQTLDAESKAHIYERYHPIIPRSNLLSRYKAIESFNQILTKPDNSLAATDAENIQSVMLNVLETNRYDALMIRRLAQLLYSQEALQEFNFSRLEKTLGVKIEPVALLNKAITINRFDYANYHALFDYYNSHGNAMAAYEVLSKGAYPAIKHMESLLAPAYIRKNIIDSANQNNFCDPVASEVALYSLDLNSEHESAGNYMQRCGK